MSDIHIDVSGCGGKRFQRRVFRQLGDLSIQLEGLTTMAMQLIEDLKAAAAASKASSDRIQEKLEQVRALADKLAKSTHLSDEDTTTVKDIVAMLSSEAAESDTASEDPVTPPPPADEPPADEPPADEPPAE